MCPPVLQPLVTASRLLRRSLFANAVFSGANGLVAVFAGARVAAWLGDVPPWVVRGLGAGLVAFSLLVAWQARAPRRDGVDAIVAADAAWVAASVALVLAGAPGLSPQGVRIVLALALAVAVLAALQLAGLAARRPARVVALDVQASPADVWRVVGERWADVHALVPRIRASRLVEGSAPGLGATRECSLREPVAGIHRIHERLVAWDPPRGFAYEVVRPPFPFARLRNEWRIEPRGDGARLTLAPGLVLRGGSATRWLAPLVLRWLMRDLARDVDALRENLDRLAREDAPRAPQSA